MILTLDPLVRSKGKEQQVDMADRVGTLDVMRNNTAHYISCDGRSIIENIHESFQVREHWLLGSQNNVSHHVSHHVFTSRVNITC